MIMMPKFKRFLLVGCKRLVLFLLVSFVASSLFLVIVFRYIPVPVTTFMLYQHLVDYNNGKKYTPIDFRWVQHDKISKHAFAAAIAAEDQKFYEHMGYDIESMFSAVETWLDGGRLRGASTLSQQVAKNLFLLPVRSFLRKGLEVWFTVLIEVFWDKQRILDVYLNIAEFGDHLFGVEAASRRFFGISSRYLSRKQSALLAASLPNPRKLNVDKPSSYMRQRQSWILRQMTNLGY